MPREKYGLIWPDEDNDLRIELKCFREDSVSFGIDPERRPFHFKNVVRILWGPKSAKPFTWNPWADQMLIKACSEKYLSISGCASSGKCLAPNTPVLMFDGSVRLAKTIEAGDKIMGDDSTPRNVLTTNTGRSNMVRIVPEIGDPWECNDDHILVLKRSWSGKACWRRIGEVVELSVKEYLAKTITWKRRFKLFCKGVEFPSQPVPFDAQAYGIWLGDGDTKAPSITSHDSEVAVNNFICGYFRGIGLLVKRRQHPNRCPRWAINTGPRGGRRVNPFLDFIRSSCFGPNHSKRILPQYIYNSRKVRLGLLAGLIDSDGYSCGTYFGISCSLPELTNDIVFLARSLGFRVSKREKFTSCKGKRFLSYAISIMGNVQEIPTLRKKCTEKKLRKKSDCTGFKIEQLGVGDWCGFEIDGNHRFLLGDFTVSHNTHFCALWGLVNWLSLPNKTLILLTSTSLEEARRRIWGDVEGFFNAANDSLNKMVKGMRLPGRLLGSTGKIRTEDGPKKYDDKCGIQLISGDRSKEKENIGKLIGLKNQRVILLADELPELSPSLVEAAKSNLMTNPFFQMIGSGNFASVYDPFGEFSEPIEGWASVSPECDEWPTKDGICLRFDALKSPNIMLGYERYPGIYAPKHLEQHRNTFGEHSSQFWRMCRSFPCPEADADRIYSEADLLKGNVKGTVKWMTMPTKVASLDPAFATGGDKACAKFGMLGMSVDGVQTLQLYKHVDIREDVRKKDESRSTQVAKQFRDLCIAEGVDPKNAAVDASGGGLPFAALLAEVWTDKFLSVQFGGSPSNRPASVKDRRPAKDAFGTRVAEIWYAGVDFVLGNQIKGLNSQTCVELTERRKQPEKKGSTGLKIHIETKKDMKLRTKGKSPDDADATLILIELCRERLNFTAVGMEGQRQNPVRSFKHRAQLINRVWGRVEYAQEED